MDSTGNRLGFSTLGVSGAPIAEVATLAIESGWRGLELRSSTNEPVHVGMTARQVAAARRDLVGTVVLAIASYVQFASPEHSDEEIVAAALAEAELARAEIVRGPRGGRLPRLVQLRVRAQVVPRRTTARAGPSRGHGLVDRAKPLAFDSRPHEARKRKWVGARATESTAGSLRLRLRETPRQQSPRSRCYHALGPFPSILADHRCPLIGHVS